MLILQKAFKCLILLVISLPVIADSGDRAAALFDAGEWPAAADAYASQTLLEPENANAWFRLAVSARQAARLTTARSALAKAEALKFSPFRVGLERARLEISSDNADAAIDQLRSIAARGFTAINIITGDSLLQTLAGKPAYDALIDDMAVKAFPCEHDASFSQFDFWVGEWRVHDANGMLAGSNVIERAEHNCVLTESWISSSGGTGRSINYLDKITGEWVQVWNDASGNQIQIRGGMTDDGMRLSGTIHYVSTNTTAPFRGLWTALPDGRVRQFFEQSPDDGTTWTPWFEGFYSRGSESADPAQSEDDS